MMINYFLRRFNNNYTYGNILDKACLCIGEICTDPDAILDPESCDIVLCILIGCGGNCCALLNGYRHGLFGTSFWNALLSWPPLPPTTVLNEVSLFFDERRLKILDPKPGGSSKPLLLRLR